MLGAILKFSSGTGVEHTSHDYVVYNYYETCLKNIECNDDFRDCMSLYDT